MKITIIISLPPKSRFNPFIMQHNTNNLFDLFRFVRQQESQQKSTFISYHRSYQSAINHTNNLLTRFLVLDMLLGEQQFRFSKPLQRHSLFKNRLFNEENIFRSSLQSAEFRMGPNFQRQVFAQTPSPVQPPVPPKPAPQKSTSLPVADVVKQELAKQAIEQIGADNFPVSLSDPVTMEPFIDPLEINNRVYGRSTIEAITKNGIFTDPIDRKETPISETKPATYMLDAIVQHARLVNQSEKPALMETEKNTRVFNLVDMFEEWEKMMKAMPAFIQDEEEPGEQPELRM